jgi:glycosyltransferase involved in cell wall biosynthesis
MRVAIDGSAIPQSMAGAGVYTYQLVRALAALPDRPEIVVFARAGLFDDVDVRVVPVRQMAPPARLVWEQTFLPVLLHRNNVGLLHSPHHHTPVFARARSSRRLKRVVTLHDVTFMRIPDRYPLQRRLYMEGMTRTSVRVADALIVPSEAVRADVAQALGDDRPVAVVAEAAGPQYRPVTDEAALVDVRRRYHLPDRFLLSVGSLEPGKNRGRIILACRSLFEAGEPAHLAIVGQPAWKYQGDQQLVASFGLEERVHFLGYVPDSDMPALYSAAMALIFPSLYEGFGLPVLEAMACGTPVITANVGATAEVGAGAAMLVDPRSVEAISGAMRTVLADEEVRAGLRKRGLARAREFSWARTARETLAVYEGALARS